MNVIRVAPWLILAGLMLAGAGAAHAADDAPVVDLEAIPDPPVIAPLDPALAGARERLAALASRVEARRLSRAESRLQACVTKLASAVESWGEARIAGLMGGEMALEPESLIVEREARDCAWGDLMIAYALDLGTHTMLSVSDLLALNRDGLGWAEIAAGLGLDLESTVRTMSNETRVVAGLSRGDGRVAAIRRDPALAPEPALAAGGSGAALAPMAARVRLARN